MLFEKLHIVLSLLVGLIVAIGGLVYGTPLLELGIKLLLAMSVFFVVGLFVKYYLTKYVFTTPPNSSTTPEEQKPKEDNEETQQNIDTI